MAGAAIGSLSGLLPLRDELLRRSAVWLSPPLVFGVSLFKSAGSYRCPSSRIDRVELAQTRRQIVAMASASLRSVPELLLPYVELILKSEALKQTGIKGPTG